MVVAARPEERGRENNSSNTTIPFVKGYQSLLYLLYSVTTVYNHHPNALPAFICSFRPKHRTTCDSHKKGHVCVCVYVFPLLAVVHGALVFPPLLTDCNPKSEAYISLHMLTLYPGFRP